MIVWEGPLTRWVDAAEFSQVRMVRWGRIAVQILMGIHRGIWETQSAKPQ